MIINYILTAWRNLVKNRVISIINILGLTLGLASAVMALLFAWHELSYESNHHNADRVFKVFTHGSFGEIQRIPSTFGPVGSDLVNLFPEIEVYSISMAMDGTVRAGENIFNEDKMLLADQQFFNLFTIPFIEGEPTTDPLSVVISGEAAQRYFGRHNPIGEYLTISAFGERLDFEVTGVFRDHPSNTHLNSEFIIPFSFADRFSWVNYDKYWGTSFDTYLLTSLNADYKDINTRILSDYNIPIDIENLTVSLMPIKDIHLEGTWESNKVKLIGFLIGGLFVLITSCFNYINLTNILFSTRTREIGIRKATGGNRWNIFNQFLADTTLSTLISFNLAILLIKLILPWFNSLMDSSIVISPSIDFVIIAIGLLLGTIILSGIYPAIRYSIQKPVDLMKPGGSQKLGGRSSRYLLTTFQFILAIIFIQIMMVINKQGNHLDCVDVKGYNGDNVICISGYQWGDLNNVKDELLKSPAVEMVTWGNTIPTMGMNMSTEWKDEDNRTMASLYTFEPDYLDVYQVALKEGRFFSSNITADREGHNIVINEEAAIELGYDDPLNRSVMVRGERYTIIGVIDKYMAFPPIFNPIPMLIRYSSAQNQFLIIKVDPNNRAEAHRYITATLRGFNSEYPIDIQYHQEILDGTKEARSFITAFQLINLLFLLTIVASLVGLFGLSLFIAQRHRKEIGVRKVCGASVYSVTFRLLRGLIKQVIVAVCIATPLAFMFTKGYLSVFPYRIEPSFLFFLSGGGIALLMLTLSVGWQTWIAANANPTEALRTE